MTAIVILNYIKYEETIQCIKSILEHQKENIVIIVVDNGSENESIKYIQAEFMDKEIIIYIQLDRNIGFAKGNNVGIARAIEIGVENIILMNSDIVVKTPDFIEALEKYCFDGIGVINPLCENIYGKVSRPSGVYGKSLIKASIKTFIYYSWELVQHILKFQYNLDANTDFEDGIYENGYMIQGCSYMITKDFLNVYKGIYEKTFLYNEELNLAWYLKHAGLKSAYAKGVIFEHREGRSTNKKSRIKWAVVKFFREMNSFIKSVPMYIEYSWCKENKYNY